MEAMKIYKGLSQPPKTALREIKGGNLNGKTDINPQWRYEAMTEQFGLVGIGWKYEIQKLWTEPGAQGESLAFAQVAVYIRDPDTKEWSDAIVGIGGSKLTQSFTKGLTSNDEGYKMAVTDAFSTSLKMIGVAADIYAGKWDGSKYKDQPSNEPAHQQAKTQGPADGPDTEDERKRINELLSRKMPDGSKMFTPKDCQGITAMRATKTAAEVIQAINEEIHEKLDAWNKAHESNEPEVEENPNYNNTRDMTPETEAGAFDVF